MLAFPRTTSSKEMPSVAEANARKRLSVEVTKADISHMCQQAGGEEETEVYYSHLHFELIHNQGTCSWSI